MSLVDPVRFSNLKHLARSPLHYHHAVTVGRADKPWLRGGRGLHSVLFGTPYVVFTGGARRGKAWETFLEVELSDAKFLTDPGSAPEVILESELPTYERMAASIRAELRRQDLSYLLEGDIEKRIEWEWLGRKCAGTPDVLRPWSHLVDVKTTCNADPRRFVWDARKFFYAEQLTWYAKGDREHRTRKIAQGGTGVPQIECKDLYIIAVEKTAPHPVVVWRVTDRMREQAEKTLRLWFEQLLACEASSSWPSYVQSVQELDVQDGEGITLTIEGEDVDVE